MTAMRGALMAAVVVAAAAAGAAARALPPSTAVRQGGPPPGVGGGGGGSGGGGQVRRCPPRPDTVPALELSAYAGRWYQVGVTAIFAATREDNRPCVTADYMLREGALGVLNCKLDAAANKTSPATVGCGPAVASRPSAAEPGELVVQFPGVPFPQPYRVITLAGRAADGYRVALVYSCVSTDRFFEQTLFVLSRTPQLRYGLMELAYWYVRVLARGVRFGRDNPLLVTPQGGSCVYRGDKGANVVTVE